MYLRDGSSRVPLCCIVRCPTRARSWPPCSFWVPAVTSETVGTLIAGIEAVFRAVPLSFLEVWGAFAYLIGALLMVAAFGGFTVRPGGRWGIGREHIFFDARALSSIPITFVMVFVAGYLGSGIVLVPGAQTFESLKDVTVFVCIILFGFPALLAVPPAYMLSDLVEGVPPAFLQDWVLGYFINPACFWLAHQLIGKSPDFRRWRTWAWYLLFVLVFMSIEPELWGYICAGKFTPEISYRVITPALFFTTALTWATAPLAMLVALPLARRLGMFWADIPGRARERALGRPDVVWMSGQSEVPANADAVVSTGVPVRMFIAAPLIALMLLVVSAVAYVSLRRGEETAYQLAGRLHQEMSKTIDLQLDDYLATRSPAKEQGAANDIRHLLAASIERNGRAFILERSGKLVASSVGNSDTVVDQAARVLAERPGGLSTITGAVQFRFDLVTAKPLSRETWLAQATPYSSVQGDLDWIEVTAVPEANYLGTVRTGNSQSAMIVAVALILSLIIAALLSAAVTAPILRISRSAEAMSGGDQAQRLPRSRLTELDTVAASFNHMVEQLQQSRQQLEDDIQRRKRVEESLRKSEENLEMLVGRRTQELAAANQELEAFSYSVSHDLRAPLRTVSSFASVLAEDCAEHLDEKGQEHIGRIVKACARMSQLIDGLLNLGRIARSTLNTTPVNLSLLAEEIVQELKRTEPSRAVGVSIEPDLTVEADAVLIRQVLHNLLSNAWKFTARTEQGAINVGSASVDGEVSFYVSDNGAGFDMAHAGKLFGTFQRLHAHEDFEGNGVGLALVQRIVHRHGGRVWATGAVHQGATISFTLPARAEGARF